jgi:hypothetical protein
MGGEELDSEKTTEDKGTVIADNTEAEAYRVAGRMLQSKLITAEQLQIKVDELKAYKPAQIKDFEKSIFASKKGLNTASDGKLSQAVIINETSNVRDGQEELSDKLASLFSLEKQNAQADEDPTIQLRRTYGK